MKKDQGKIWLARKLGARENAGVIWNEWGNLELSWNSPNGPTESGTITPKLARLLAKRIIEALED